jgi:uncharacterized protein with PIN domain/sulfur carrier protein ThiS
MASAFFRFYEELNDFLPRERHKVTFEHQFEHRGSVKDMIESLGVPHPEVEVILVDGESVGFDHIVRDGDRIGVYPMFESIDVSPLLKLRSKPLRRLRFLLDVHLGTLARYLRLCGFDTQYRNDYEDDTLARISAEDACVLLTRDRNLLKRRIITHGYCVRHDKPRKQLAEVIARFDLYRSIKPFKRCAACNGLLQDVEKSDIEQRSKGLSGMPEGLVKSLSDQDLRDLMQFIATN